ncbi:putative L-gulonolactone oxidase 6 [Trifolium repens]|nr:putative L-gulonolactone oxidase 6 [Trifolium repens]
MLMICSKIMREQKFKSALFIFLFIIYGVISTPPADPIKCSSKNTNCTITNANGVFPDRSICKAGEAMYPTSETELISIVALASKNNRKMKVATRFSHSIPKLACPDGQNGLLISTKNLNRVLKIDVELMTMTVESGVTLRQIISEAARFEMAYWWGLTIGGLIGTGAHGSTLWGKGSAVHEHVIHIRIVSPAGPEDGYAKVRNLDESHQDLNAARVSLGVLGVISQVTLKLEPLFKRSLTYLTKDDSDLGDQLISFGRKHEFADVSWYRPSQQKVVYRIDDHVLVNTSGNGLYDFTAFRSTLSLALAVVRSTEELQEATRDANGKCISAKLINATLAGSGYGLTNNGIFRGISLSFIKNFVEDVQKLVELEPKALCGLEQYNGILMRYVTASSAYLGKTEDAVDFDITYYRSKDPLTPRLFEDIIEEIEQIGLFKYGGLPHWGKNRNIGFIGAINKYNKADKFLKVKEEYDPQGLFSSEWTNQVLGLKEGVSILKDGCALEGLCICSQDSHCAPTKSYFCRPGRIYKEARVCRRDVKTKEENDTKDEL